MRVSYAAALMLVACAAREVPHAQPAEPRRAFDRACVAACAGKNDLAECFIECVVDVPGDKWRHAYFAETCSDQCTDPACVASCCAVAGLDPWCCQPDVSCTDTDGVRPYKDGKGKP